MHIYQYEVYRLVKAVQKGMIDIQADTQEEADEMFEQMEDEERDEFVDEFSLTLTNPDPQTGWTNDFGGRQVA